MGSFNGRQLIRTASVKLAAVFTAALFATMAHATVLLDTSSAGLTASDPTQLGRLSRNGIAQDWSGGEAFPGVINPAVVYHYTTFTVFSPAAQFLQISFDSLSASTFASAYLTSYNPGSLTTNWLGDAGTSGNFFGTDPLFFQVTIPAYFNLVIVVNETVGNGSTVGLLQPFRLIVEGFIDTEFTDIPVPTPGTVSLFGVALLGFAFARKKISARA